MSRTPRTPRPPRSGIKGWKAQSILVFRHLTGRASPARRDGLMPGYAHHAYLIAVAAGRLAGMAKKRWRDDSTARMLLRDVQQIRGRIDRSFDELERILREGGSGPTGVRNQERAEEVYARLGLVGHLGLCLMEEAAELAEPIHAVATGTSDLDGEKPTIDSEAADLRTYQHLVDTAFGVDTAGTTQAKWEAFLARMPDAAREALGTVRLSEEEIRQSMVALARRTIQGKDQK